MNAEKHENNALKYDSDAFSQVLQLLKLDVSIYFNARMSGEWCVPQRTFGTTCFHAVTAGCCKLDVPGHFHGLLQRGDLAIFPRELAHTLSYNESDFESPQGDIIVPQEAANSADLLCGEVRFQHKGSRYLLDALPRIFVIRYDPSNRWLSSILEMVIAENQVIGPASQAIFNKLAELLFTYAIRQYLSEHPKVVGMLAIYGHPRLARVASAIHQQPDKNWTLDLMAKEIAVSRTTFAETFKAVSGWTAGQYLTWWRMQLAWSFLSGGESVAQVAAKVGYRSESAFSHAFQNMFSVSAGKVRRGLYEE